MDGHAFESHGISFSISYLRDKSFIEYLSSSFLFDFATMKKYKCQGIRHLYAQHNN